MALYGNDTCRIEFLSDGFRALLMGDGVKQTVYQLAQDIAADAGDGFTAKYFYGRGKAGRVMATVDAETPEARRAQASDKVLSMAAVKPRSVV